MGIPLDPDVGSAFPAGDAFLALPRACPAALCALMDPGC